MPKIPSLKTKEIYPSVFKGKKEKDDSLPIYAISNPTNFI